MKSLFIVTIFGAGNIRSLLANQLIEYTIHDKPNSRVQKYRLRSRGKELQEKTK
jgi:hypothetical protein